MSYSRYLRTRADVDEMCSEEQDDFETFCDWLDVVEDIVRRHIGVKMVELHDHEYRVMFDDGWDVDEVAQHVVQDFRTNVTMWL